MCGHQKELGLHSPCVLMGHSTTAICLSVSLQLRAKVDVSFAGQTVCLLCDVEWRFLRGGAADPEGGHYWATETVPMLGLTSHQVLVPRQTQLTGL